MKNELARLIRVKRNKDISSRLIIERYNNVEDLTLRLSLLKAMISKGFYPIGIVGGKELTLEEYRKSNIKYPFKYKEEETFSKKLFAEIVKIIKV